MFPPINSVPLWRKVIAAQNRLARYGVAVPGTPTPPRPPGIFVPPTYIPPPEDRSGSLAPPIPEPVPPRSVDILTGGDPPVNGDLLPPLDPNAVPWWRGWYGGGFSPPGHVPSTPPPQNWFPNPLDLWQRYINQIDKVLDAIDARFGGVVPPNALDQLLNQQPRKVLRTAPLISP